ncbi:MAG: hypothetical protein IKZ33_02570, partial [Lentisphaeria bacterium]|nr:hypothetical protein [Lentisphaeria bacterium]
MPPLFCGIIIKVRNLERCRNFYRDVLRLGNPVTDSNFRCEFSLPQTGLYFYYFHIFKKNGSFRLFKQGDQTNMEDGDRWQLSCIP